MSWLRVLIGLVGLIRDFFSWKRSADDRQAGRDAARAEALNAEVVDLRESQQAVNDAARRHAADGSDGAFNKKYMRDD